MEFSFNLAGPADDPDIRRLLAHSAMPGALTVTFEREPDYFLGTGTMGPFCQVVLARHQPDGELAGMLVRAVRPFFINGQVEDMGYVGQIRVADHFRGSWLLTRGLPFFRSLHTDGRAKVYYGVISDENQVARGVLVDHRRRSFPQVHHAANIVTLGIILRRPQALPGSSYRVESGSPEVAQEVAEFLQHQGASRQFFPVYTAQDLAGRDSPVLHGFDIHDLFIARNPRGRIAGVVGLWDQSGYKQTVVQAYRGSLRWLRPFYNLGARVLGAQPLPAPGEHIHSVYASLICTIEEDSQQIFRLLLRQVVNLAAERRYAHLMLGLTDSDPLLQVAREYPHITYRSQLYLGYWDEGTGFFERLDGRIPYIEIATL